MGKLGLDINVINEARGYARNIAENTQLFIDRHTTASTERAVLRLMGIDGVDALDVPLMNVVVDKLSENGMLSDGAAYFMGCAMLETGKNPQEIAELISIPRSTVQYRRTSSFELLKKFLEERADEW